VGYMSDITRVVEEKRTVSGGLSPRAVLHVPPLFWS